MLRSGSLLYVFMTDPVTYIDNWYWPTGIVRVIIETLTKTYKSPSLNNKCGQSLADVKRSIALIWVALLDDTDPA